MIRNICLKINCRQSSKIGENEALILQAFIIEVTTKIDVSKDKNRKETLRWKYINLLVNSFWKNTLLHHLDCQAIRSGKMKQFLECLTIFSTEFAKFLYNGLRNISVEGSSTTVTLPSATGN